MNSKRIKYLIFSICIVLLSNGLIAQSWEHLTPVKSSDRLKSHFVLNDSTAYMGGFFGRLIKTTNGGESWAQMDDVTGFPITGGIWGMHFPSTNVGYIPDDAGRIYKTIDGSASWTQIYNSVGSYFYDTHFFNEDLGFVCGEFGELLKTVDGGDSWESIETGVTTRLYDFCFTSDSVGYIALRSGDILKSNDSGNTWLSANLSNSNDLYQVEFFDDSLGIAVGLSGTVLRTIDAGLNWESIDVSTTNRLIAVAFASEEIVLLVGDYGMLLRSEDGGESFEELDALSPYNLWGLMRFDDGLVYAYGDRNVFESFDDGSTWDYRFDGVPEAQLMRILFTDSSTAHSVGRTAFGGNTRNAIIKSKDKGRVWNTTYESLGSSGDVTDISFIDEDHGFASAYNTIRKTSDGGESNWEFLNEDGYFTAVHFFNSDTGLVGNTLDGIFRSTDGGNNWEQVDWCGDVNHFFFLDRDTGYAAVDGGSIRKTTDGGATWIGLDLSVTYNLQSVFFVNDSTGYAVGDWINGIKTTDYGATWTAVAVNQFGRDVYCPDPNNPDSVYALVASGEIQKSIDGGSNWSIAIPAMNNQQLWDMEFLGPYIYACGDHGDILRARIVPCNESSISVDTTVCEVFVAHDGSILDESGNYSFILQNSEGCDSIVNIYLTVNEHQEVDIEASSCTEYTAPDGEFYSESGEYTAIIQTENGCDSIINISLTIIEVDLSITNNSPSLIANALDAAFQWVDCDNDYAWMENENDELFTASSNGNYAVIVEQNACTDTSECILITNTSIQQVEDWTALKVYPNPSNGWVNVDFGSNQEKHALRVLNPLGQVLQEHEYIKQQTSALMIEEKGFYFLEISLENGAKKVFRIVIN